MNHTLFSGNFSFVDYVFGKYRYTDSRSGAPRHFLAAMEEGHCRIVSEGLEIEAAAGDAFYIPMGLSYQSYWYSDKNIRFRSYGFGYFPGGGEYRLQKLPEAAYEAVRSIPLGRDPDAAALGAMYTVLAGLIPSMKRGEPSRAVSIVREAISYMRSDTALPMPQIANRCCVSESTLYAAFRTVKSATPNDVRQQLLVERAVNLLTTTSLSVQEISDMLGFNSPDYFRRVLRKHTGRTPSLIRSRAETL